MDSPCTHGHISAEARAGVLKREREGVLRKACHCNHAKEHFAPLAPSWCALPRSIPALSFADFEESEDCLVPVAISVMPLTVAMPDVPCLRSRTIARRRGTKPK